jgi:Ca2+-binding RTX toxin-like protein
VNDRPTLVELLRDVVSREDVTIDLDIPAGSFADVDGDVLSLTATMADGSALPDWLRLEGSRLTGTPPLHFHGALNILVLASDGALTVSAGFRLTITPENDSPVLLTPLRDAVAAEDRLIDIAVPADTFGDADGDVLALSAALADGSALPGWLRFENGRLIGTPPANYHGELTLRVSASDGASVASDLFRLTVLAVNDAPILARLLPDVARPEDVFLDLPIPFDQFTDVDGDVLTLTARLANGRALPGWLSFDGVRFTGTPPADYNGAIDLVITASDGQASASGAFRLTVTPVNDAPTSQSPLADRVQPGGFPLAIDIPEGSFTDVDGDALTLTARLADGAPLPAWLVFDGAQFTGTPPRSLAAQFDIEIVASDGRLTASQAFALTITPSNAGPTVGTAIGTVTIQEDSALDFALPASAFVDPDGDTLTLTAALADGRPLPAWIAFDGRRFTGTPPANQHERFAITLRATDGEFHVGQTFDLVVAPVNDAPTAGADEIFLVKGGDVLTILPSALLENDTDVEGDTLKIAGVSNGRNGLVTVSAAGEILYTPDLGFVGEDSFAYTVSDGQLASTGTVLVRVSDPFAGWQQGSEGADSLKGNMSSPNEIFAGEGDDHVKGGKLADRLAGGAGADHLQGMQGDDILYGMAGNDKLNGGEGFDTAVLSGDRSSYVLTTSRASCASPTRIRSPMAMTAPILWSGSSVVLPRRRDPVDRLSDPARSGGRRRRARPGGPEQRPLRYGWRRQGRRYELVRRRRRNPIPGSRRERDGHGCARVRFRGRCRKCALRPGGPEGFRHERRRQAWRWRCKVRRVQAVAGSQWGRRRRTFRDHHARRLERRQHRSCRHTDQPHSPRG